MTLTTAIDRIRQTSGVVHTGRICKVMPTWLEADGPNVPVGTLCRIGSGKGSDGLIAEVIRVDGSGVALAPFGDVSAIATGNRIEALSGGATLPVGMGFLGRAVDALAQPIDSAGVIVPDEFAELNPDPPSPLERETPLEIIETGIKAIDALHTIGTGQRIGVFAASGVGKTSLMSQMLRQVQADVCVVCLVGERGREVEAIWSRDLDEAARKRTVVVAATSDKAAALRVRAVHQAVALARHFRDQGLGVFFVLDSVTRYAMALREKGLAAGEPPTVRAYTPSVFSQIPRMVEQFGALKSGGSITALLTVLAETDDIDDPLAELMKSLLDGHLLLSRTMAERGHFPAVDPLKSVSRNAHDLMPRAHLAAARKAVAMLAKVDASKALIDSGLYTSGSNAEMDAAIDAHLRLEGFLRQGQAETVSLDQSLAQMMRALENGRG